MSRKIFEKLIAHDELVRYSSDLIKDKDRQTKMLKELLTNMKDWSEKISEHRDSEECSYALINLFG